MNLPPLDEAQEQHQQRMRQLVRRMMGTEQGLPFHRFMELALYAPGLGYYVAGAQKFGTGGDFVTAPEISPVFSRCLARQCAQILEEVVDGALLEFGAGSGIMAADILAELERLERLPSRYIILELGAELRHRQRQTLAERVPHLQHLVEWQGGLPDEFSGVMLANEVLDAMPVHLFRRADSGVEEAWVVEHRGELEIAWRTASDAVTAAVTAIESQLGELAPGYVSEVNLRLAPWINALGESLRHGAALLVDYGYTRDAYYHPERHMGTLICHLRHQAHADPLLLPGLQDITASVDFTAVAEAGRGAGFELAGYATQAAFLVACGLDQLLAESAGDDLLTRLKEAQKAKQLVMPAEMGERFKVMALAKGLSAELLGFTPSGA